MRLEIVGFWLSLLLSLGLIGWGGAGVLAQQRDLRTVSGPIDDAWISEWLCIRRDECGTPSASTLESARATIEAERVARRAEYGAARNQKLLIVLAGVALMGLFYLARRLLTGRFKPLWVPGRG